MASDELMTLLVQLAAGRGPVDAGASSGASGAAAASDDDDDDDGYDEDGDGDEDEDEDGDEEGEGDRAVGVAQSATASSAPPRWRRLTPGQESSLRARCADLLEQRGELAQAELLLAALVNLTAHDAEAPVPCLCKACLDAAPATAEAQGAGFSRTFVVAGTRVLHFWLPDELRAQRAEIKRSMARELRPRVGLAGKAVAA